MGFKDRNGTAAVFKRRPVYTACGWGRGPDHQPTELLFFMKASCLVNFHMTSPV